MLPVVALVGRPNVGKSTLFNRLTRTRDALVADFPGLTRDRQYGFGKIGPRPYVVVDTGGISGGDGVEALMERQVQAAIDEADHLLFLLDAHHGVTAADLDIAAALRRTGKPLTAVVNKIDHLSEDMASAEFHSLGLGDPWLVAAVQGRGVNQLMEHVAERLPDAVEEFSEEDELPGAHRRCRSTQRRQVDPDQPHPRRGARGRLRQPRHHPRQRRPFPSTSVSTAIPSSTPPAYGAAPGSEANREVQRHQDTAGHRRLQCRDPVAGCPARHRRAGRDAGRPCGRERAGARGRHQQVGRPHHETNAIRPGDYERRLGFLDFAELHRISALHGSGVGLLLEAADAAYANAIRTLPTPELTRLLEGAVQAHQPPLVRGRRIKLRYAHQGGRNPPIIVIHGNQTDALPAAYRRYLINRFRSALKLAGTPLRLELRSGENPYEGRTNRLTPRQARKRQRLKAFVRRKEQSTRATPGLPTRRAWVFGKARCAPRARAQGTPTSHSPTMARRQG
jgi:GTP-binding protein